MPKQKMILTIGAILGIAVLAGGGWFAWSKFGSKPTQPTEEPKKRKVSEPVNAIPVSERPYVQLAPRADGRHIDLKVLGLKKPATEVVYEFEYQSDSLLQAAFDTLQLASVPANAEIKLYSCGAGGKCTYHTEIKGGKVLLKFKGDSNYALKSDWRYVEGLATTKAVSSQDAKFQLASPDLKTAAVAIVYNTPGYPEGLTGTAISDPYSLAVGGTLKGKGELTMRANEEGSLSIMAWDGSAWKAYEGKVDGKQITATVGLLPLYVVVKK